MPAYGLGDASEGETIYFDPGAEVTVSLPDTLPLSIFTVGQEIDECGRVKFQYYEVEREKLVETFKNPSLNWLDPILIFFVLCLQRTTQLFVSCGSDHDE